MRPMRRIGWLFCAITVAHGAETERVAARQTMEASVERQRAAVAAMRISIEKQRASVQQGSSGMNSTASAPGASAEYFTLAWPPPTTACAPLQDEALTSLVREAAQKEAL